MHDEYLTKPKMLVYDRHDVVYHEFCYVQRKSEIQSIVTSLNSACPSKGQHGNSIWLNSLIYGLDF